MRDSAWDGACFVLGPHRSGTTIFTRSLAESGEFVYLTAADIVARHRGADQVEPTLGKLVMYPMGFFTKGFEGRIDDPNGGWNARGLWGTYGGRAPWHSEGGKGTKPLVVHFQLRSSPLEK